ncbi:MAG: beta-ketoacyl-[acyl-carrier-protein] synthase family protein, partial [Pirellulales bacterium]
APIYGEVLSWASSNVVSPDGVADRRTAVANVIKSALRAAEAQPSEIGHVHAHGISTRSGDAEEAQALAELLGIDRVPVTAAKSYFGNLGSGSGMVELIASLSALEHQQLFPILNYETPDDDCPVLAATGSNGLSPGSSFLNISYTPQGQAACVLVRLLG